MSSFEITQLMLLLLLLVWLWVAGNSHQWNYAAAGNGENSLVERLFQPLSKICSCKFAFTKLAQSLRMTSMIFMYISCFKMRVKSCDQSRRISISSWESWRHWNWMLSIHFRAAAPSMCLPFCGGAPLWTYPFPKTRDRVKDLHVWNLVDLQRRRQRPSRR